MLVANGSRLSNVLAGPELSLCSSEQVRSPFQLRFLFASLMRCVEIGKWYVSNRWTNFQRRCLAYIAEFLPSIRGLVNVLGDDALEEYCRHGCLDKDRIVMIEDWADRRILETDDDDDEDEKEEDGDDEVKTDGDEEVKAEEHEDDEMEEEGDDEVGTEEHHNDEVEGTDDEADEE